MSFYKRDGEPLILLNEIQKKEIEIVKRKIEKEELKQVRVESCVNCGSLNKGKITEKDRYGFYFPIVICQNCGLVYSELNFDKESNKEFYNLHYRKIYVGTEVATQEHFNKNIYRGELILDFINKNKIITKDMSILEIGCGGGWILYHFDKEGYKATGIDFSEEYTRFGREKYNLNISTRSLEELEEEYELIIISHVLEHVLDISQILVDIKRKIKKKSLVYIEVPGMKSTYKQYPYLGASFQNAHVYYFSLKTLERVMNKNGFSLIVGDEDVRSLWKYEGINIINESNDFKEIIKYLKTNQLKQEIIVKGKIILKKLKLFNFTKKTYYRYKGL